MSTYDDPLDPQDPLAKLEYQNIALRAALGQVNRTFKAHTRAVRDLAGQFGRDFHTLKAEVDVHSSDISDMNASICNLDVDLTAMHKHVTKRFNDIDTWRDSVDQRFDGIDQRFDGIDQRFDGIDQRFHGIDQRFDGVDRRFDAIETKLDAVLTAVGGKK